MQSDPFQYLSEAGNHPNTWILFLGPLAVFIVIFLILAFYLRARRARDAENLMGSIKESIEEKTNAALESQRPESPKTTSVESEFEPDVAEVKSQTNDGWIERLRGGLSRSRDVFAKGLQSIFVGTARLDAQTLEQIHEILYRGDVGVSTSDRLVAELGAKLSGRELGWSEVKGTLNEIGTKIFSESTRPLNTPSDGLFVILIVGVNGVGKTTTIGKLAARLKSEGKKVMLCAADTFRAAAIEQLEIWGQRNNVPVIRQHQGSDPAAVAFDGVQAATARGMDVLIIDTAGRLHNKNDLMAELSKINKSIGKGCVGAPHETWLVVDATTGQNAVQQVKAFKEVTHLSGIVVTKLDGTAKGGVIIGIADQFKIPIRYIGVGEKVSDLRAFDSAEFMSGLLG